MRLVGIDYGKKRVGLAVSDEQAKFALPHSVVPNDGKLIPTVLELCKKLAPEAIIVGESRNLDGKENEILHEIMMFRQALEDQSGLRVYLEPEFYTSAEAERVQGKNAMHDASTAALILKSYIERHGNN